MPTQPTAQEQLMLELINRARLDPAAEAKRLHIDLNDGLAGGSITNASKAPLAFNSLLIDAARAHSRWMSDTDILSHTGKNGSLPEDRIQSAGYKLVDSGNNAWETGENIAYSYLSSGTGGISKALTAAVYVDFDGLMNSAYHRHNILYESFREVGIGQYAGTYKVNGVNQSTEFQTQDYAVSGRNYFITGVIYKDANDSDFYDVGEGVRGTVVASGGARMTSWSAGGYQLAFRDAGDASVSFTTGRTKIQVTARLEAENAKIDLVDGTTIDSSVSLRLVSGVTAAHLLGTDDLFLSGASRSETLVGNAGDNLISGNRGHDVLIGGDGNDILRGGIGNDRLNGGAGRDQLSGGAGKDILTGGRHQDSFHFDSAGDRVTDFVSKADDLYFDHDGFRGMKVSNTINLVSDDNPVARKAAQTFLFDESTHKLYFDADGTGKAQKIFLVTLDDVTLLRSGDIHII